MCIDESFPYVGNSNEKYTALIIFDLETTGTRNQRIIEIAAWNAVSESIFHQLVYPGEQVHPIYGTGIHHLTDSDLVGCDAWSVVGNKFLRWVNEEQYNKVLLLSHGPFDRRVLTTEFDRNQQRLPENWNFCNAQKMICRLLKVKEWSVKNLCIRYGMKLEEPTHRAESDVATQWKLYERVIHEVNPLEVDITTFIIKYFTENHPIERTTSSSLVAHVENENLNANSKSTYCDIRESDDESEENDENPMERKRRSVYLSKQCDPPTKGPMCIM